MHVIQRGHDHQACFFAVADYLFYLRHLEQQATDNGCLIHAYVLMTNHVHLLVTPDSKHGVSLMMKNLNQRYVQYVNNVYDRSGTLWGGRFKSCLTETDKYALACYRYIEMNPVRANMVEHPVHYRWSSYVANANAKFDSLVSPHSIYLSLGASDHERGERYRALIQQGLDEDIVNEIRFATNSSAIL
jgi:putative transposase